MSSSENLVANTPSADVTPPVDVVLPTVDAVNVKAESSTPSKQDTAPLPTATQQYQPLLPRTTPVSIRPLPTLSPYGLSPTNGGVPLSNYSARMYRPPVIPSKEDQSKGRKGRRKRTTPYQLAELMKVFQTNESPGHELREDLTGKVGMTNREVQVWFQNRRAKEANRAKRVEQVDANRPGLTGYRKMSSTSSNSDMSSDTAGSSECISSLSSSTSTTTLVNSETSGTVKTTSTQQHHHRPIKMAPRKNSFSTVSPSALYSSPFGRMAMAFAAPDGRIMFLQPPEPTPSTSQQPLPSQQQQQQNNSPCLQQPFQFLPSPTFFSSQSNFTTQPQVMLVPVLMPTGSYPLNALSGPVVHRGLKSGTDVVPRSVSFPETKTGGGEKRRTEVGTVEAEKEKYAEAANVLASLATA